MVKPVIFFEIFFGKELGENNDFKIKYLNANFFAAPPTNHLQIIKSPVEESKSYWILNQKVFSTRYFCC